MKVLGIVRKIDDLGRVVIPKEVRDTQGWKSGTALEMYMDKDGLVLKPYKSDEEKEYILGILKRQLTSAINKSDIMMTSELEEVIEFIENK